MQERTILQKFKDIIEEKDSEISTLKNQQKEIKTTFKKFQWGLNEEKDKRKECPHCDFEAASERGVRTQSVIFLWFRIYKWRCT